MFLYKYLRSVLLLLVPLNVKYLHRILLFTSPWTTSFTLHIWLTWLKKVKFAGLSAMNSLCCRHSCPIFVKQVHGLPHPLMIIVSSRFLRIVSIQSWVKSKRSSCILRLIATHMNDFSLPALPETWKVQAVCLFLRSTHDLWDRWACRIWSQHRYVTAKIKLNFLIKLRGDHDVPFL